MKKKLIFVTEALWIGGIETALINLLNRIDYNQYEVTLLVCKAALELKNRVPSECKLIIIDRDNAYSTHRKYPFSKLYHLTEQSEHPSALHKAFMWLTPVVKWIENELFIRYVRAEISGQKYDTAIIYSDRVAEITIRGIAADKYLMFYHNALMEKRYHDEIAYKKCDAIIAVSQTKADELKAYRPQYADKIIVIHNLVDIDRIIAASKEKMAISYPVDAFNIVTCGRLAHQKGIDWAILACRQLLDAGYHSIQWWVVGGGPDESKLRKQIQSVGVEEHFHLLGMQNNPYPYIANADLYVQPSRYENYSVVILEAMVLQKQILATIPAAKDQIKHGVSGYLCIAQVDKLAEGIEYLYLHSEEREKYQAYLQEHSLDEENSKIMEELYQLF